MYFLANQTKNTFANYNGAVKRLKPSNMLIVERLQEEYLFHRFESPFDVFSLLFSKDSLHQINYIGQLQCTVKRRKPCKMQMRAEEGKRTEKTMLSPAVV